MMKVTIDQLRESTSFILAIQSEKLENKELFIKKLIGKVDLDLNKVQYEVYVNNELIYTFFHFEKALQIFNSIKAKNV